jgi:SAM-dependent methyltransferase
MFKQVLKVAGRPFWERLQFRIDAEIDRRTEPERARVRNIGSTISELKEQVAALKAQLNLLSPALEGGTKAQAASQLEFQQRVATMIRQRIFVPSFPVLDQHSPFMQYSTCSATDLLHPRYAEMCAMLGLPPMYQRKFWEWAYIIHHLREAGMLSEGRRGLGFGVGKERLPALFAKFGCQVTATDAPSEIGIASGWSTSNQHSAALAELKSPEIVADAIFDARVTHQPCDMNAIGDSLRDFDFTWSSCCFEHLGDLEAGLQFVINSVEKTLKPGGVAVHTTEYNLSSNDETVESGDTVIYRKRDMEDLISRLRERGHEVHSFVAAPHAHPLDFHVDAPPYIDNPHLKLRLASYTTTSAGICVRRKAD